MVDIPKTGLAQDHVFKRTLLLYGLHAILFNLSFVFAYYVLPDGLMRSSPQMGAAEVVARQSSFWSQFALIVFFNLGVVTLIIVLCNFNRIRGVPVGYLVPVSLAVVGGLVVGTNSFLCDDLERYNSVREAMALGQTIGGLETLGFILIAAATVPLGIYHYRSWWRWSGRWKPERVRSLRDIRLSRSEAISLVTGVFLLIIAAYRETAMAAGR
jgi:hypothetical protein